MRTYRYRVVDVFTDVSFSGNQLAVFLDAAGLSDGDMQSIARELNLAETAFVFSAASGSDALASVRIFTPDREMPFAGHPTIGTAFALLDDGRVHSDVDRFVLDERIGPIEIVLETKAPFFAWLRTPPIAFGDTLDRDACAAALGLTHADLLQRFPTQIVSAGNPFLYVPLEDSAAVDRAALDVRAFERIASADTATGVFAFALQTGGVYSRMLAPLAGVPEDPATGSATGPLAAYLFEHRLIERRDGVRIVSEQGVKMRRRSLVHARIRCDAETLRAVDIGGSAVAVIDATMTLPAASLA